MFVLKKVLGLALGAPLIALANPAAASTASGTIAVSMTVQASCTVASTSPISFGTSGVLTSNTDATGSVTVQCTNTTPYTIALDQGAGTGASTSVRKLTSSANTINYALYRDNSRTLNWGNTQGTDTLAGTGNGSNQVVTVYGRVPVQTSSAPGSYTDTVNVTITY